MSLNFSISPVSTKVSNRVQAKAGQQLDIFRIEESSSPRKTPKSTSPTKKTFKEDGMGTTATQKRVAFEEQKRIAAEEENAEEEVDMIRKDRFLNKDYPVLHVKHSTDSFKSSSITSDAHGAAAAAGGNKMTKKQAIDIQAHVNYFKRALTKSKTLTGADELPGEASQQGEDEGFDNAEELVDPTFMRGIEEEIIDRFRNKDYYRQIHGALTNTISLDNPDLDQHARRLDYSNSEDDDKEEAKYKKDYEEQRKRKKKQRKKIRLRAQGKHVDTDDVSSSSSDNLKKKKKKAPREKKEGGGDQVVTYNAKDLKFDPGEGDIHIVIQDTRTDQKVREIMVRNGTKVEVHNQVKWDDPDFDKALRVQNKHRLKYYLRDFNDIRDKINRMFAKFGEHGEIYSWTEAYRKIEMEQMQNFSYAPGGENNPPLFQTSKELFKEIQDKKDKEMEQKMSYGGNAAQFEEEEYIQKQIEKLRAQRLGLKTLDDSLDIPEKDLLTQEEFDANEFRPIRGMDYLNRKGLARYKHLTKLANQKAKELAKKKAEMNQAKRGGINLGTIKQMLTSPTKVEAPPSSTGFADAARTKSMVISQRSNSGGSELQSQLSQIQSPGGKNGLSHDPSNPTITEGSPAVGMKRHMHNSASPTKENLIDKIRQKVSLQIMKTQEGRCRTCERSFSSSSSDIQSGSDDSANPNYMKFMMSRRQRKQMQEETNKRERGLKILREYQNQLQQKDDVYNDIKVPIEFITKFEIEKGFEPGSAKYAPRQVKDEIRIRFLQREYQYLEEFHHKEMRALEIKLRSKMHMYTRACLETIKAELLQENRLTFVQLDLLKAKAAEDQKKIAKLQNQVRRQEVTISELMNLYQWEPIAHRQFTERLKKDGLTEEDMMKKNLQQLMMQNLYGLQKYYSGFVQLTPVERDTLDITKPFSLYSHNIRLSFFEKLNLLERETVMIYQQKVNDQNTELDFYKSQNTDLEQFQEILSREKNELKLLLRREQDALNELRVNWDSNLAEKDRILKKTVARFETRIDKMKKEQEDLHDIFVKEIEVKDNILDMQKEDNEKLIEKAKELTLKLKTPRHHYEFLQEKGTLEPFIKAMLVGDDIAAKWILQDAAKGEIKGILNYYKMKDEMDKKKNIYKRKKKLLASSSGMFKEKGIVKKDDGVFKKMEKQKGNSSLKLSKSPFSRDSGRGSPRRAPRTQRGHDPKSFNGNLRQWNDSTSIGSMSHFEKSDIVPFDTEDNTSRGGRTAHLQGSGFKGKRFHISQEVDLKEAAKQPKNSAGISISKRPSRKRQSKRASMKNLDYDAQVVALPVKKTDKRKSIAKCIDMNSQLNNALQKEEAKRQTPELQHPSSAQKEKESEAATGTFFKSIQHQPVMKTEQSPEGRPALFTDRTEKRRASLETGDESSNQQARQIYNSLNQFEAQKLKITLMPKMSNQTTKMQKALAPKAQAIKRNFGTAIPAQRSHRLVLNELIKKDPMGSEDLNTKQLISHNSSTNLPPEQAPLSPLSIEENETGDKTHQTSLHDMLKQTESEYQRNLAESNFDGQPVSTRLYFQHQKKMMGKSLQNYKGIRPKIIQFEADKQSQQTTKGKINKDLSHALRANAESEKTGPSSRNQPRRLPATSSNNQAKTIAVDSEEKKKQFKNITAQARTFFKELSPESKQDQQQPLATLPDPRLLSPTLTSGKPSHQVSMSSLPTAQMAQTAYQQFSQSNSMKAHRFFGGMTKKTGAKSGYALQAKSKPIMSMSKITQSIESRPLLMQEGLSTSLASPRNHNRDLVVKGPKVPISLADYRNRNTKVPRADSFPEKQTINLREEGGDVLHTDPGYDTLDAVESSQDRLARPTSLPEYFASMGQQPLNLIVKPRRPPVETGQVDLMPQTSRPNQRTGGLMKHGMFIRSSLPPPLS